MKALVCILSATQAFVLNHLLADIFKSNPNYLENEEKYKAIKADLWKAHPTMDESGSEESDSEDDDEGVLRKLIPNLVHY